MFRFSDEDPFSAFFAIFKPMSLATKLASIQKQDNGGSGRLSSQ
jgi:hypothetical protein